MDATPPEVPMQKLVVSKKSNKISKQPSKQKLNIVPTENGEKNQNEVNKVVVVPSNVPEDSLNKKRYQNIL